MDDSPLLHLDAVLTILGMGLATYGTRAAGLFLMSRVHVTPRLEGFLKAIPGAILISIVAPGVLAKGPADMIAGAATVLVAVKTKNLILAMVTGVILAFLLRAAEIPALASLLREAQTLAY